MKCFLLILIFALSSNYYFTQLTYGGTGTQTAVGIAPTNDGHYFIVGTTTTSIGDKDILLIKINEAGDTLWTKTYGTPTSEDEAVQLLPVSDGHYLLLTKTEEPTQGARMYKLNDAGGIVWEKFFLLPDGVTKVVEDSMGDYYVLGKNVANTVLLKVASDSTVLWSKSDYDDTPGWIPYTLPLDLEITYDNKLFMLRREQDDTDDYYSQLYELDTDGVVNNTGNANYLAGYGCRDLFLLSNGDGDPIITGNTLNFWSSSPNIYQNITLTRYDNSQTLTWIKDYDTYNHYIDDVAKTISVNDTDLFTIGHKKEVVDFTPQDFDLTLTHVNATNGNILSKVSYGWSGNDLSVMIIPSQNHPNEYLWLCNTNSPEISDDDWDMLLLKIDGETVGIGEHFTEKNSEVTVFPNPTNGTLHIDFENSCDITYVKLMNVLGKTVYQSRNFSPTIDVVNLEQGVYFLQLNTKKGVFVERVVKN